MDPAQSPPSEIHPFRIDIPGADLDDMRDRLRRTRWAEELPLEKGGGPDRIGPVPRGWEYGVPIEYVRRLVDYWLDSYDWRAWEPN